MAQTKQQILDLLATAGAAPRHRFGQNFMIDQNLVRLVAEAGEIQPGDWVIEVGPGTGTLTGELLSRVGEGGRVVAVEIDRDLAELLRQRLGHVNQFQLIQADALAGKHELNPLLGEVISAVRQGGQVIRLVANLPYNIASPLVIELLLAGVELLAFTVQKEVAQRLKASAGQEAYGPLTVMAHLLSDIQVLRTLPPQAFWPAPKVESALVRMRRRDRLAESAAAFHRFVQTIFASRRKMLRKALAQAGWDAQAILAEAGIDGQLRPEELSPERIWQLFQAMRGRQG